MERPTGAELRIRRQANKTPELRCHIDFALRRAAGVNPWA